MRAKVRSISTYDVADQTPEDASVASVSVTVTAGPADGPGEETFDVVVVTPGALKEQLSDGEFLQGRHFLITNHFDWQLVTRYLREQFEQPEAASWSELATILGRIGSWEFEDYQP